MRPYDPLDSSSEMQVDEAYLDEMLKFKNVGLSTLAEAEIDADQMPFIMKMVSAQDKPLLRFVGAMCLKCIFKQKIKNQNFKDWIHQGHEFVVVLISHMFTEQCLPIKIELVEATCDMIKQLDEKFYEIIVNEARFLVRSIETLRGLTTLIAGLKLELVNLFYNMIWGIGMILQANNEFVN